MKGLRNYLVAGAMLLIALNPFSSYAYSTRYSLREVPNIEQREIYNRSEFVNRIMIDIPLPPIPLRILHPTKPFKPDVKPVHLPPAPKQGDLEKTLKPAKEVRLEFP